jgi:flagellar motor component MotA
VAITQPQPSIASALITGAVIGFVVIFAIVCTALLIAGSALTTALGFSAFVALFGGPGFGTMFGANWYVHRSGEPR